MRNRVLITRVSSLAIAAALTAAASAQSFLGEHDVVWGSVNILESEGITDAFVESPTAVINWTPDDNAMGGGPIVFQPVDTTANFFGSPGFAVLNQIMVADPSRAVALNGAINGLVNESPGGNIFFYSPSGFIIGSSAVVNVGSLVLSASPIAIDGSGNFIEETTVTFGQAPNPDAAIVVNSGSLINAPNEGSYVALVAPRIEHRGTIDVNGAAALVGAEAATINFRPSGLFDISVEVGTTDANGVVIDGGVVTGVASSGANDAHRVYAVAVPKNTALTMLISGGSELGFDVAGAADVDGNAVVLSAGHDLFFGSADLESDASGAAASINMLNSSLTSALGARASGNIDVGASAGETMQLASNASLLTSGGYVQVEAVGSEAVVDILGDLQISTDNFGSPDGQSVTAGQAAVYAQGGGQLFVGGDVNISANGFGGDSFAAGVAAGNGTGGQILVEAEGGSSVAIAGNIFATADGYGGQPGSSGVDAGNGTGGNVYIGSIGDNADFSASGSTYVSASGYGGAGDGSGNECFSCNGLGGTGTGGTIIIGTSTGSSSTAYFGGFAEFHADAEGGRSAAADSASGTGSGGTVQIFSGGGGQVEGFGTTFASDLVATAIGRGGESFTSGIAAGLGEGGAVRIFALANSSLGILGDLDVDADGVGGYNDFGIDGGDGIGGQINLTADGGNASVVIYGTADLEADGEGSFSNSDCLACGGAGGNGTGGLVEVFGGSGTGNAIALESSLDLSAEGYGGIGVTGVAGIGEGGEAIVHASPGLAITIGSTLRIEADGHGGTGYEGNSGGAGIGGNAAINGVGGSLDVIGDSYLNAGGFGGGVDFGTDGNGGAATGGIAQIYAQSGSLDFSGDVFVEALGEGGSSSGGNGGDALGGIARIGSDGGTIRLFGDLLLDGGAIGGDGVSGGDATARVSPFSSELDPTAISIYANGGGSVSVEGMATLDAQAVGGSGSAGNGGNAQGGEADIVAYIGSIDIGSLDLNVDGIGGDGGGGGNGGNGLGGVVDATFGYLDAAVDGSITVGSVLISANGIGGTGGSGIDGPTGGDGGNGGNAVGGNIIFAGSAGGGTLVSGPATLTAVAIGGAGGNGGNGATGNGGAGGDGGSSLGGFIQTGTISADGAATSGGGAAYTSLTLDTSVTGGAGGNGGAGEIADGNGGDGGSATGGAASFLARGVLVTADTVELTANATGGNGGTGQVAGNGGNAMSGFISVESKERFGSETERGTLEADSITGTAIATGGAGAVNGIGMVADGSYFRLLNGDATIGSVSILLGGDSFDTSQGPSLVSVRDGSATITGSFSFTTDGELALDASNGSLSADTISLSAATFAPDTQLPAQTAPGSYAADSFDIVTGGDFITNADLVSVNDLLIDAPGSIIAAGMNSSSNVTLTAGSSVMTGDIIASGSVAVDGTTLDLGDVRGDVVDLTSTTGNLSTADIIAFTSLNVLAAADFLFGSITAPLVDLNAPGSIIGGFIDSEGDISAFAGEDIDVGDLSAGGFDGEITQPGNILLAAGGSISTGNAAAEGFIDMYAEGGAIAAGDLSAAGIVFLEAASGIGFGDVAAEGLDFEAGGAVNGGDIVTSSYAIGEAGGAITLGDITAGPELPPSGEFSVGLASATSISVGNVSGTDQVGFATFGDLVTGDIEAGSLIMALVGGNISVGSLTTAPDGEVYMADAQMYLDAGGNEDDFDPSLVLAQTPLATGGAISIGGPVLTGLFRASAGTGLSTGAVSANAIEAQAGGTATINGLWQASDVQLRSADIEIGQAGGIDAGAEGEIVLMSSASGGAFIGDGIIGEGYSLSNAEFGQLSAGNLVIVAGGVAGADADMLIGDLSITGPTAGSTIESSTGGVSFIGLNEAGTEVDGTIRIVGEVTATGFGSDNYLAFISENFQLDAATGLISIESSPGTLGGILYLEAANIHVAEGDILDRLETEPQYAGYQDDLNAPASVPRPDGVIRAETVEIEFVPAELNTLYVQNTGTAELPAGFLISDLNLGDAGESGLPAGSIDLIINGQIVTADGVVTGIDVRDLLVEGRDLTPFTDNSTVNGCLLAGACDDDPGEEPPVNPSDDPQFTPVPGIQTEIKLILNNLLPPPPFDNEAFIDDNDEATDDGSTSPIEPPHPLFDTSGLGAKGDVEDPVSGSGNPALMETPPPSSNREMQP